MKKILVVFAFLVIVSTSINVAASSNETFESEYWYNAYSDSTCSDNQSSATFRGGTLVYGCTNFAVDEEWVTYTRAGSDTYRALVSSGNGYQIFGGIKSNGNVSDIGTPFYAGTQRHGIMD